MQRILFIQQLLTKQHVPGTFLTLGKQLWTKQTNMSSAWMFTFEKLS